MDKDAKKTKILMIEDDLFFRKLYRDKFNRAGFKFIEAINGVEGINKAITDHPDLILLDLVLPRKNGFDVLIELKDNQITKDIPVIILSNLGQESDVKEGLALGAEDYLVKSEHRLAEVVKKVKKWLAKEKKSQ